jgi:hypothetical protein
MKIKVRGKNTNTAMPEFQVPFQTFTIVAPEPITENFTIDGGIGVYGTSAPTQQTVATDATPNVDTLGPPSAPNYTMVFTVSSPVGFTSSDAALTLVLTVKNLQARVNELEAALQAYGLLS